MKWLLLKIEQGLGCDYDQWGSTSLNKRPGGDSALLLNCQWNIVTVHCNTILSVLDITYMMQTELGVLRDISQ